MIPTNHCIMNPNVPASTRTDRRHHRTECGMADFQRCAWRLAIGQNLRRQPRQTAGFTPDNKIPRWIHGRHIQSLHGRQRERKNIGGYRCAGHQTASNRHGVPNAATAEVVMHRAKVVDRKSMILPTRCDSGND